MCVTLTFILISGTVNGCKTVLLAKAMVAMSPKKTECGKRKTELFIRHKQLFSGLTLQLNVFPEFRKVCSRMMEFT
jgi:hypothetical protein